MPDAPLPALPAAQTSPPAAPLPALPATPTSPPAAPLPVLPDAGLIPGWASPDPGGGGATPSGAVVRYDIEQQLTAQQRKTARENISAPGLVVFTSSDNYKYGGWTATAPVLAITPDDAIYFCREGDTIDSGRLLYPQIPQPVVESQTVTMEYGIMPWWPDALQNLSPGLYQITLTLSNPVFAAYESHQLSFYSTPQAVAISVIRSSFYTYSSGDVLYFASPDPAAWPSVAECVFTMLVSGSGCTCVVAGSLPVNGDTLGLTVSVKKLY